MENARDSLFFALSFQIHGKAWVSRSGAELENAPPPGPRTADQSIFSGLFIDADIAVGGRNSATRSMIFLWNPRQLCVSFRFLLFRINHGQMYAQCEAGQGQDAPEVPPCQVKYCESSFLNLPNPIGLRSCARQGYPTIGRRSSAETHRTDLWKRPILGQIKMAPRYSRTSYEESILPTMTWSSSFKAQCCLLTVVCCSRANLLFDLTTRRCAVPLMVGCHCPKSRPPH